MIRITLQSASDRTIVAIAGQLAEDDVGELRKVLDSVRGNVDLSLREMDSCAASGVTLLRSWLKAGAKLQDANPFVAMTLEDASPLGGCGEHQAPRTL